MHTMNGNVEHDANLMPSNPEQHLQLLKFNRDGDMFVASNEFSGSTRTAALFLVPSAALDASLTSETAPLVSKQNNVLPSSSRVGTESDSCVMDAVFLAPDQLLLGLDDGAVVRVAVAHANRPDAAAPIEHLDLHLPITEHDAAIMRLDLNNDGSRLLSCSLDRSIIVWDTMTLAVDERLDLAHHDRVSCVHFNPAEKHIFVSASHDGIAGLWDLRTKSVFVNSLYKNGHVAPTEAAWIGPHGQQILIGDEKGALHLVDLRSMKKPVQNCQSKDENAIHRIAVHPQRPNIFATCQNSRHVSVASFADNNSMIVRYSDERHTDFVRGLAWRPNGHELWTCGWDTAIISHQPQIDFK